MSTQPSRRDACGVCHGGPCVLCRRLPPEARADLAAAIRSEQHGAGAVIPHAARGGVAVVAEGLALVERSLSDERRQVVTFRFPGDLLCLDEASGGDDRLHLIAVTPVTVCRLPAESVREIGGRHAALYEGLLRTACREVARLGDRLLLLARLSASERIATFLLEMLVHADPAAGSEGGTTVRLPMSREDIADYLGLNVETVSRTLSRFKREGLIQLPKPGRAVIGDAGRLKALAPIPVEGLDRVT